MADQEHFLAVVPGLPERRSDHRADFRGNAANIVQIAARLAHGQTHLRTRDDSAETRQRIPEQMHPPPDFARERLDLGHILVRRIRLVQDCVDARFIERDVSVATVKAVGPGHERQTARIGSQLSRRLRPRPGQTRQETAA
jgi:hypothetical protein